MITAPSSHPGLLLSCSRDHLQLLAPLGSVTCSCPSCGWHCCWTYGLSCAPPCALGLCHGPDCPSLTCTLSVLCRGVKHVCQNVLLLSGVFFCVEKLDGLCQKVPPLSDAFWSANNSGCLASVLHHPLALPSPHWDPLYLPKPASSPLSCCQGDCRTRRDKAWNADMGRSNTQGEVVKV